MPNRRNFWVIPHGNDNWAVKQEGNPVLISTHYYKEPAIEVGRRYARQHQGELIVCRRDGTIKYRNTYSPVDPFPPRG